MNPNNELDRQRLMKAIENSTRVLRPFRDVRKRLVKDFAGSYYGQSGSVGATCDQLTKSQHEVRS